MRVAVIRAAGLFLTLVALSTFAARAQEPAIAGDWFAAQTGESLAIGPYDPQRGSGQFTFAQYEGGQQTYSLRGFYRFTNSLFGPDGTRRVEFNGQNNMGVAQSVTFTFISVSPQRLVLRGDNGQQTIYDRR